MTTPRYSGYLTEHVPCIVALHEQGASSTQIAEHLYAAGLRVNTTEYAVRPAKLVRKQHVLGLRGMVLHVLQRLGLRTRHKRPQRRSEEAHDQIEYRAP